MDVRRTATRSPERPPEPPDRDGSFDYAPRPKPASYRACARGQAPGGIQPALSTARAKAASES